MKKQKITKQMNFREIMEKNPDAIEILFKNGMHCIGCGFAASETLEEGALMHGLNPEKIVREINEKLDKKRTKRKIEKKGRKKK